MRKKQIMALVMGMMIAASVSACGTTAEDTSKAAEKTTVTTDEIASSQTSEDAGKAIAVQEASTDASVTEGDSEDMITGGWSVNQGDPSLDADENKDVKAAFEKATTTLTGVKLTPVAYLGSQVVAGTNYSILCTETDASGEVNYVIAYMNEDLDGNVEMMNVADFDISQSVEY